jgi:hypothetical protein
MTANKPKTNRKKPEKRLPAKLAVPKAVFTDLETEFILEHFSSMGQTTRVEKNNDTSEETKKIKSLCEGKVISISSRSSEKLIVPLFCPLCDYPMKTRDDSMSYKNLGCCEKCDIFWRSDKDFKKGIQEFKKLIVPDKRWAEYHKNRINLSKSILNIK